MYRRDTKQWLKHLDFMVLDLIILQISLAFSYVLRHGWANPYAVPIYSNMAAFLLMWDLVVIFFTEPFRNILKRGYYKNLKHCFSRHCLLAHLQWRSCFCRSPDRCIPVPV